MSAKRQRDPESTHYFLIILIVMLFVAMLATIFALLFGAWVWLIFAGFAIIPTVALIFLSIEGIFGYKP